jgi:hypothetical protein
VGGVVDRLCSIRRTPSCVVTSRMRFVQPLHAVVLNQHFFLSSCEIPIEDAQKLYQLACKTLPNKQAGLLQIL